MMTHDLIQGSPEWHTYRANHFNASDAPAMMSCSPYKTRTQLLNERKTGLTPDVDAQTQRIFNDGHRYEELARPLAEKLLGEDLFPVTGSLGHLSASFDGLTMDEAIVFEHKSLNDKLRAVDGPEQLPLHYRVQMEQQLLVSGARQCLFMASKWDNDELADEKHFFYSADVRLRQSIIDGWFQFELDLESHEVKVVIELPKAEALMELPAVIVQVKGELTLCNMADVRPQFDGFLVNAITVMVSDEDFARAEAESKMGRAVAKRCIATAKGVIDQTATISEVTRELEQYAAKFNALALSQEKAVKTQKEARKLSIMNAAKAAFGGHLAALEVEIRPIRIITGQPDFNEAMKNKRLIAAIQNAVDSELARVKIDADVSARLIRVNLELMTENAPYKFLFNDLSQIIYKPFDDLKLLVSSRIADHEKREAEKLEAQRLQIAAEEKRKAEAEQAKKLEVERAKVRAEELAKIAEERRLERIEFDKREESERLAQAELNRIEQIKVDEKALAKPEAINPMRIVEIVAIEDESFEALHIMQNTAKYLAVSELEACDKLSLIDWLEIKYSLLQSA